MPVLPERSEWTAERIELLRSLAIEVPYLTFRQMAERINTETRSSFSRNATLSKYTRIGLPPRAEFTKPLNNGNRNVTIAKRRHPFKKAKLVQLEATQMPETTQEFLALNIFDLKNGQCKFPRGDYAPYEFCGQPSEDGSSYCSHHKSICWTAPVIRERKRGFVLP